MYTKLIGVYLFAVLSGLLLISCTGRVETAQTNVVNIILNDEITEKTLIDFNEALKSIENNKQKIVLNAVQLNSDGGSGVVGREIGQIIRKKRLNTFVAEDAHCESACVFVLLGGVQRYAFGQVGVHRATYDKDIDDDSRIENDILESQKVREGLQKSAP
jgi:hypothetical protein